MSPNVDVPYASLRLDEASKGRRLFLTLSTLLVIVRPGGNKTSIGKSIGGTQGSTVGSLSVKTNLATPCLSLATTWPTSENPHLSLLQIFAKRASDCSFTIITYLSCASLQKVSNALKLSSAVFISRSSNLPPKPASFIISGIAFDRPPAPEQILESASHIKSYNTKEIGL